MEIKKMTFGGTWYPAGHDECKAAILKFLKEKQGPFNGNFVGGIVPHAGWFYSGSIACRVIASLQPENISGIDTILLFGAHMQKKSRSFILVSGGIETPFGTIEVDQQLADRMADNAGIQKFSPAEFVDENTFELQYPFIRYFYPNAKIVVCGVAPSSDALIVGRMAVKCAEDLSKNIRVIGSTDMTHYGPDFRFTPAGIGKKAVEWVKNENDKMAIDALKNMDAPGIIAQGLEKKNMCCPGAAAAAIAACRELGAVKAAELDYATSFEKSAGESFVGYSGMLYARP